MYEKDIIEIELKRDMERLDLNLCKIIFSNQRKKRHTLLVKNKGKLKILKWNHPSEKIHLEKLKTEINFYTNYQDEKFLPKYSYKEENLILIDHINGITLREWLINYKNESKSDSEFITEEFEVMVKSLTNFASNFYNNNEKVLINNTEFILSLKHYFYSLYFDGPMSLIKKRPERVLLRLNKKLYKRQIDNSFKKVNQYILKNNIEIKSYSIHSDLHLNNILVSMDDHNVLVIDWENLDEGGICSDLNYLYAFIMYLLEGLPQHQRYLEKSFENYFKRYNPELVDLFFEVNNLYKIAISVNRSFGHNLSFNYFINSLIKFPFKILSYSIR